MDTYPFRFLNLRRQRPELMGLLLVTLLIGLSGGVVFDRQVLARFDPPGAIPAQAIPAFQLIGEAWNIINQVYVDHTALQPGRLAYGAISGMVAALGDTGHSRFLTSEMAQELLATAEWLTPDGRLIWRRGIAPDVVISLPSNTPPLLPELEQGMSPTQLQTSSDQQLLRALTLLAHLTNSGH